jgi:hypothetical protein
MELGDAQRIEVHSGVAGLVELVGEVQNWPTASAQKLDRFVIHWSWRRAPIQHTEHDVGLLHCERHLLRDVLAQRIRVLWIKAAGIDQHNFAASQVRGGVFSIARDAWSIMHDGQRAPRQAVE